MLSYLLIATVVAGPQSAGEIPIRVGNVQFDPVDLSVTYGFVNEAADVTAYEVSITRHFSDGSTLVSTQGQDWFSSSGYSAVRAVAYSAYSVWLPPYPDATPGTHVHKFSSGPVTKAVLVDAQVTLTAVIRLDGSAIGRRSVLDRLFSERRAMLSEYMYWVPLLERAGQMEDSVAAFDWIVRVLGKPRRGEILAGPRQCLRRGAEQMLSWSTEHPADARRVLEALIKVAAQQQQFLVRQSIWNR